MAWTDPRTWSTGEIPTAAQFNTHIRDNLNAVHRTLAYVQFTAQVNITPTSEATAQEIVSAGAVTYAATPIIVEFVCPEFTAPNGATVSIILLDGATVVGRIGRVTAIGGTSGTDAKPLTVRSHRFTPSAGSHTYKIAAYTSTGTASAAAGTGGPGGFTPGYIHIISAIL